MSDSTHIVCPHCQAVNRLPTAKLEQGPKCGQCHEALFEAHPVELTESTFATHIGRNDVPVLVDFWAPWCGPCRTMAPWFAQASAELEPHVRFAKVNTEEEQMLGGQFGIRSIPTMILFRGGREVARQSGAMPASEIVRWTRMQMQK